MFEDLIADDSTIERYRTAPLQEGTSIGAVASADVSSTPDDERCNTRVPRALGWQEIR